METHKHTNTQTHTRLDSTCQKKKALLLSGKSWKGKIHPAESGCLWIVTVRMHVIARKEKCDFTSSLT